MDRIIIENVRCFRGRHEVPLAPVTFLVGENSTGKSTFLALTRIAWDVAMRGKVSFNEEPFLLGAYDQIASSKGKRRSTSFLIGLSREWAKGSTSLAASTASEFVSYRSQPALKQWRFDTPPFSLLAEYGEEEKLSSLKGDIPSGKHVLDAKSLDFFPGPMSPRRAVQLLAGSGSPASLEDWKKIYRRAKLWEESGGTRPYAFAPIRTRPLRTYDPVKEVIDPEGGHVPMILAGFRHRDEETWRKLRAALDEFGNASGLFGKVDVRRLGESEGDPFQVQVVIDGMAVNLVDVGYGVSQILPILVDVLRGESGGTFLLQQPEVHLHPRAQAALGSFLATLAKEQGKRFLVETHSDHMVDRIRMDLRDKKYGLRPEDVQILYFERKSGGMKIHPITFDDYGNLQDVPLSYRQFFLQEERRMLGI